MRYKWIALVLACALLLCGCTPIERVESAGVSAQTTATTTKRNIANSSINKGISFKTTAAYRAALLQFDTLDNIQTFFDDKGGKFGGDSLLAAEEMQMFLEDRFFVVPTIKSVTAYERISFGGRGCSSFFPKLHDGCTMLISVYHQKNPTLGTTGNTEQFVNATGISFVHYIPTKGYLDDEYRTEIDGYTVTVTFATVDTCKNRQEHLDSLTLEKVEIK